MELVQRSRDSHGCLFNEAKLTNIFHMRVVHAKTHSKSDKLQYDIATTVMYMNFSL